MSKLKSQKSKLQRKIQNFLVLSCGFALCTLTFALPIQAQVKVGTDVFQTPFKDFGTLVSVIVSNLYIIAGIVLLFLIIFGGFGIISGAGSGDQQKTAQGKQALTSAIIGFLIIFTSYWIIQLIEVITGLSILKPNIQ